MSESRGIVGSLEPLMTYQDLSRMLGIAPRTVLNLTRERPERMPVCVHLPGVRGPRWRPETVRNWVAERENEQRAVVQQKVEMQRQQQDAVRRRISRGR